MTNFRLSTLTSYRTGWLTERQGACLESRGHAERRAEVGPFHQPPIAKLVYFAPLAHLVEHSLDKGEALGSKPRRGTTFGCLAQLVEHCTENAGVRGSKPRAATISSATYAGGFDSRPVHHTGRAGTQIATEKRFDRRSRFDSGRWHHFWPIRTPASTTAFQADKAGAAPAWATTFAGRTWLGYHF